MSDTTTHRSPLKSRPLRVAGQSLDNQIQKVLDGDVTEAAAILALVMALAAYEWFRWWWSIPPTPLLMTLLAVGVGVWAIWRIARARRKLRNLRQGRDGERAVAELLERLREGGFRVFHDVVGEGFNVDHVLIGPQGLFAIETKTITKPNGGNATIAYDGESVTLAGWKPDRDPVRQAAAAAKWVQDFVKESTGRVCRVRPVVLYPGWFIDAGANKNKTAWVLNPKALHGFIQHEPTVMQPEDVRLISYHLSRYCRTVEAD